MTDISDVLALARQGFHMFPLSPGAKTPAIRAWQRLASRDPAKIKRWAAQHAGCNWGIFTGKYGDDAALIVVDVDIKPERFGKRAKHGNHSVLALELDGFDFPNTLECVTPSGGRHLVYRVDRPVRQGVDVLGPSIDIRSHGGYIVAPGSVTVEDEATGTFAGKYFVDRPSRPQIAPEWIVAKCGEVRARSKYRGVNPRVDVDRARKRARDWLRFEAPEAISGAGGNNTTFFVAAELKDLGVTPEVAAELMTEEWHDGCGWTVEELETIVGNAYRHGHNEHGCKAPEAQFEPVEIDDSHDDARKLPPLHELNRHYALVSHRGQVNIYREQVQDNGQHCYFPMKAGSFELALQSKKLDGKPLSKEWKEWPLRREYNRGLEFAPGQSVADGVLNLWGGFAVRDEPGDWSLFRTHIRDNVCGGDSAVDEYVMNWLAHLVQKPHQPPGVAIILRGRQGSGKGVFAKILGDMFGEHYLPLQKGDHLTGKFNSHLACKVLVYADEAFFVGDREAEPALKAMLTEETFLMEAKGFDAVQIRNCAHVIMASNDDWIVPASHDQRRYCVIDVSDRYKNDALYFDPIFAQMREAGGTAGMLHDLLRRDISEFRPVKFPQTAATADQKISSLKGPSRWLYSALCNGWLAGHSWDDEPVRVQNSEAYIAYSTYAKEMREYRPVQESKFWQVLTEIIKGEFPKVRLAGEGRPRARIFPPLADVRKAFEDFHGTPGLLWGDS
ncbi:bifunctional DNA primase/polymerase [Luteibacter sp. RCC_6_2]|uniref:bifunctional DNA primase/polymerase n=1 Tax=Luteibacter sp. RCC_6_2 TaxID=3239223 RepID=UPI003525BBD4